MKLQWLALAPPYRGSTYTYVWRPYIHPPETIDARFYISAEDEGSRNVLILLQGWDRSKGSLSTYQIDRVSGPPGYVGSSSNVEREIHLYMFAVIKQLIADSSSFVDGACEEVAQLVSLSSNVDIHFY